MANERSLGSGRVEFDGAIDMHVHFGPEPLISRASGAPHAVDPRQAAQEAAAAGMKAIVLKAHEFPSHLVAQLVSADAPDVHVVGSICCDFPVGGLNPVAVEAAVAAGAGMVWLPTISSANYADHFGVFGWEGEPGISLLDEDGNLLPVVREILDLVHQYGAVLATGHISRAEHFKVIEAYRGRGPIVVTHAMQERPDGPTLSEQDCLELAAMGASIELTAHSCVGIPATLDRVTWAVRQLPPDSVVLSSDYGWSTDYPHPAPGLRGYLDLLYELGAPMKLLRNMSCTNPGRLLAIDA
jgi:hypothetical protein